ncbi:hypothetical protein [Nocardia sp. XZ_19_385]|uniref:hypothetical protein n=1 Tax=Nocardia sp. XZ_19_385 TaxID=2769488 RepID=UPI0021045689
MPYSRLKALPNAYSEPYPVCPDVWSFAVAEGDAEVSASPQELLAFAGHPADATTYLEQQAREGRVVVTLRVARLYGTALDIG